MSFLDYVYFRNHRRTRMHIFRRFMRSPSNLCSWCGPTRGPAWCASLACFWARCALYVRSVVCLPSSMSVCVGLRCALYCVCMRCLSVSHFYVCVGGWEAITFCVSEHGNETPPRGHSIFPVLVVCKSILR